VEAAIKRLSFFGVSARDNSKQWEIRRLSQFFCLGAVIIKYPLIPISPAYNWGRGQSWKCPATRGVLIVMSWRESSRIRLQWTQKYRKFLRARGNKMLIDPRQESRFRQLEPIKNKRGQKEKFEMRFEKSNTEWAWGE
jgi:hypothetical protein